MKLRRRYLQTLGVSVKQLRRKLLELGARILHIQDSKPRDMALVMLSVSQGMEVGSSGHGTHGGLGGALEGDPTGAAGGGGGGGRAGGGGGGGGSGGIGGGSRTSGHNIQEAMLATARDRAIRADSVRQDLALDLPPRLQLPDGEERPYGAHTSLHLRDPVQESEIYQKCVRAPPNRTVFDSESPPPYRSQSTLHELIPERIRSNSTGSSILRVFRKFPSSSSGSMPAPVVVPTKKPALSSYSESSSNPSNLSNITMVPCETEECRQEHQQNV